MPGQGGELPDDVGQAPVGDALELIGDGELQGAPAHVHWDDGPLRERHAELISTDLTASQRVHCSSCLSLKTVTVCQN